MCVQTYVSTSIFLDWQKSTQNFHLRLNSRHTCKFVRDVDVGDFPLEAETPMGVGVNFKSCCHICLQRCHKAAIY